MLSALIFPKFPITPTPTPNVFVVLSLFVILVPLVKLCVLDTLLPIVSVYPSTSDFDKLIPLLAATVRLYSANGANSEYNSSYPCFTCSIRPPEIGSEIINTVYSSPCIVSINFSSPCTYCVFIASSSFNDGKLVKDVMAFSPFSGIFSLSNLSHTVIFISSNSHPEKLPLKAFSKALDKPLLLLKSSVSVFVPIYNSRFLPSLINMKITDKFNPCIEL